VSNPISNPIEAPHYASEGESSNCKEARSKNRMSEEARGQESSSTTSGKECDSRGKTRARLQPIERRDIVVPAGSESPGGFFREGV